MSSEEDKELIMGGFRGVSGVSGNPLGVSQVFLQLLLTCNNHGFKKPHV